MNISRRQSMKRILLGAMIFFAVMAPVTAQKVTKSTTINTASKTDKTSAPKENEAYKKGFETGIRILDKKDLLYILPIIEILSTCISPPGAGGVNRRALRKFRKQFFAHP